MLKATTCDELRPLALSTDATSGAASIDFRRDCLSSSLVRATNSSTFERSDGSSSLMSTTCMLRMTALDCGGVCASDCAGAPCACTKDGVPRESAATMTDAVKMRMIIPFQFAKQTKKAPIHEIWLASDFH